MSRQKISKPMSGGSCGTWLKACTRTNYQNYINPCRIEDMKTFTAAQASASFFYKTSTKHVQGQIILWFLTFRSEDMKTFIAAQASASCYETQAQSMYKDK